MDLSAVLGEKISPAQMYEQLKAAAENIPAGCDAIFQKNTGVYFLDENGAPAFIPEENVYQFLKFYMPKNAAQMISPLMKGATVSMLQASFSTTIQNDFYLNPLGECFYLGTEEKLSAEIAPFDFSPLTETVKNIFASGNAVELPAEIKRLISDLIATNADKNPPQAIL
jgi:hypothetical protein